MALGISYETIITVAYGGRRVRKANVWGPTTGRHFSDLGYRDAEIIPDAAFDRFVQESLAKAVLESTTDRLLRAA